MPVSHPRPNWRSVWKKGAYKHPYDLHTTAWIIKKSHKYIGIDAGGTHFALAIKDPTKDINCQRIEQPSYSLKHCQNTQTLTPTRLSPPYFLGKSRCIEIIKKKDPNVG